MDSFFSSVAKIHARIPLHFLRYGSSNSSNKQFLSAIHAATTTSISSDFTPTKTPRENNNFPSQNKNTGLNLAAAPISPRRSWVDNWNAPATQNSAKRPEPVLDYMDSGDFSDSDTEVGTSRSTGDSTVQRIVEKLKRLGYVDDVSEKPKNSGGGIEKGSVEEIFHVEEGLLPNVRGGFSEKFPLGDGRSDREVKFPWEKTVLNERKRSLDSRERHSQAELTLPELEIKRLMNLSLRVKHKGRIGGAGVTQQVVDAIHEKWKSSEVVRLKVEGGPALNMRRMHDVLERKTGGLVIWRSGTSVSLYRGVAYKDPTQKLKKNTLLKEEISHESPSTPNKPGCQNSSEFGPTDEASSEVRYEDEMDGLLDSLGPRYADWLGEGPLPVDADLFPGVVPGYQMPFRLLPYGIRLTLGTKEATSLRRLARVLPPHFALGRSRQHQGLAAAMIKIWEKSSVVKIALKRGVQRTTSERIAKDLKRLTGGILLSRNKEFLVYYRGKDFLSPEVADILLEKERLAKALQMNHNKKHGFAEKRLTKAERDLSKVEESLHPADHVKDLESLTDEERFMLRKLGLRMKAFLLLGRCGVFGGTVESMHLHWKYRKLVKIIVKASDIKGVKNIAQSLEAESGGVLVSVDKISKGYAIVIFRGRDYKRPRLAEEQKSISKLN